MSKRPTPATAPISSSSSQPTSLRPDHRPSRGFYLDAAGKTLWERRIDGNGVAPAIEGFGFHHNAMRYSYDLVMVDGEGRVVVGNDKVNENFVGWGAPLKAPADGVVVEVENEVPDNRQFDPSVLASNINLVFGNYVVIKHADGLYSVLGHVKQGSVTVKAGDTVKEGQVVAAVGASGSAMFPHLHYQLPDGPTVDSEGVPHRFNGLTTTTGAADTGWIDGGDVVVAP